MPTFNDSKEALKNQAELIRKFIQDRYSTKISIGHSLELVSQLAGFKDWNTAVAATQSAPDTNGDDRISTIGELREALKKFKDSDSVDAELVNKTVHRSETAIVIDEFSFGGLRKSEEFVTLRLEHVDHSEYATDADGNLVDGFGGSPELFSGDCLTDKLPELDS